MVFKTKQAQGHVEVILSMVLFVGFLVFIFIFINPFLEVKEEPKILDVQEAVLGEINSDIGILSVIVGNNTDCYSLDEVNNLYGNSFIEVQDFNNPRRYTIYYGDFFNQTKAGVITCLGNPGRNFTLGLYMEDEIVVYENIQEFKQIYDSDYEELKKSLKVRDFLFSFRDLNSEEINNLNPADRNIPQGVSVISKDILIRAMDKNGKVYELILNLRAW